MRVQARCRVGPAWGGPPGFGDGGLQHLVAAVTGLRYRNVVRGVLALISLQRQARRHGLSRHHSDGAGLRSQNQLLALRSSAARSAGSIPCAAMSWIAAACRPASLDAPARRSAAPAQT